MSIPITTAANDIYPWLSGHWSFFVQRLEQDRLPHALMLVGHAACGKTTLAEAMVARLLCIEGQAYACGRCRSCQLLAGGAHPDFFDIHPEEDSKVIKVDQVRGLIGKLNLTTSVSGRKVAYIHPAETMNDAQLNAFRTIAAAMQTEPTDWEWIGKHISQRMFGITEKRARNYAEKHGGTAKQMIR